MEEIATERLIQERKVKYYNLGLAEGPSTCINSIIKLFYARPTKKEDGTQNLFKWECGIPGPKDVLEF